MVLHLQPKVHEQRTKRILFSSTSKLKPIMDLELKPSWFQFLILSVIMFFKGRNNTDIPFVPHHFLKQYF